MNKYKKLARHKRNARDALGKFARENPMVLVHWKLGYLPSLMIWKAIEKVLVECRLDKK